MARTVTARMFYDERGFREVEIPYPWRFLGDYLWADVQGADSTRGLRALIDDYWSGCATEAWDGTGNAWTLYLTPDSDNAYIEMAIEEVNVTGGSVPLDIFDRMLAAWERLLKTGEQQIVEFGAYDPGTPAPETDGPSPSGWPLPDTGSGAADRADDGDRGDGWIRVWVLERKGWAVLAMRRNWRYLLRETRTRHHDSVGLSGPNRIAPETQTSKDSHGVYQAEVELRDPQRRQWVRQKPPWTFSPDDWDRETTLAFIGDPSRTVVNGGWWQGVAYGGIKVVGYVDKSGDNVVAWPRWP